jgi:hypothetical protein
MNERRRSRPREDEQLRLAALWSTNCKRWKAGRPPTPEDSVVNIRTCDAEGNPVTVTLRGEHARKARQETDQYFAEQLAMVKNWNKKPSGKDVKEISGDDVMEILKIAGMLTNHPAYAAAREAMILHQLNTGGLRRAFLNLYHRHHEPPEHWVADSVDFHMEEFGYKFRRAVEHTVATWGIPGASFLDAVDKVRKAYARREQHEAEQQRYFGELAGMRDRGHPR